MRDAGASPGYLESLLVFGDADRLVGTLARPASGGSAPAGAAAQPGTGLPTLLVFNAGVIPRMGPHRLNVKLARAFAQAGFEAFRFDLSGQGDSRPATGTLGFERQAVADVRQAMDAVSARTGATRFLVFGICSGAVLGYAAALEDERIVGAVMFDPYMYPTLRTHLTRILRRVQQDGVAGVGGGWIRGRLARLTGRPGGPPSAAGGSDLGLQRPTRQMFAAGLAGLLDRGVRLLMIYSGSALYSYNYARQFDDGFRRFGLAGRIRADFLPEVDHTVTEQAVQRQLVAHLLEWASTQFDDRRPAAAVPRAPRPAEAAPQ